MTTEDLRFPLTVWPGFVVPVPSVPRRAATLDSAGYLVFEFPAGEAELPPELFLRELLELDADSDSEVARFLSRFGVIARHYGTAGLWPVTANPSGPPEWPDEVSNHVRDAALFLRTARALTRHWLAVLDEGSVEAAWAAEGFTLQLPTDEALWQYFVECLNVGLRAFTVRAERPFAWLPGETQGTPRPDLYSALCLQLANHITENATVRRCGNEVCRRPFVRQQNPRSHGQNRTEGVLLYCSLSCGNAQWQRDHRRRKRAERKTP